MSFLGKFFASDSKKDDNKGDIKPPVPKKLDNSIPVTDNNVVSNHTDGNSNGDSNSKPLTFLEKMKLKKQKESGGSNDVSVSNDTSNIDHIDQNIDSDIKPKISFLDKFKKNRKSSNNDTIEDNNNSSSVQDDHHIDIDSNNIIDNNDNHIDDNIIDDECNDGDVNIDNHSNERDDSDMNNNQVTTTLEVEAEVPKKPAFKFLMKKKEENSNSVIDNNNDHTNHIDSNTTPITNNTKNRFAFLNKKKVEDNNDNINDHTLNLSIVDNNDNNNNNLEDALHKDDSSHASAIDDHHATYQSFVL